MHTWKPKRARTAVLHSSCTKMLGNSTPPFGGDDMASLVPQHEEAGATSFSFVVDGPLLDRAVFSVEFMLIRRAEYLRADDSYSKESECSRSAVQRTSRPDGRYQEFSAWYNLVSTSHCTCTTAANPKKHHLVYGLSWSTSRSIKSRS
jgi:hypothetical protein